MHSKSIQLEVSQFLLQEKGFLVSQGTLKYLGFSLIKNARCVSPLHQIKINLQSKLKNWELKPVSQADRMVLTKSVLLAIPTYYMSYYKFPKNIVNRINQTMAAFWRSQCWIIFVERK